VFYGRKEELKLINDKILSEKFEFGILYGRRRVGKTTILKEVIRNNEGIYFVANEMDFEHNIKNFGNIVAKYFNMDVNFGSLDQIFNFIKNASQNKRFVVVIDEFTYLFSKEKGVISLVQNLVDSLQDSNLVLILAGSQVGMIEEIISYQKPLYGRATFKLHIKPFNYLESQLFYPNFSNEDKVIAYSVFGGIPFYLSLIDDKLSIKENIINLLLKETSLLKNEVEFVLKQELTNTQTYRMVLNAIASGATKVNEISNKARINNTGNTSTYLKTLESLGIIKRVIPFGENINSRKSLYKISDQMFNFYYTFINKNLSALTFLNENQFYENYISPELVRYASFSFEEICRSFLAIINKEKKTDFYTEINSYWGNNILIKEEVELDIVARRGEDIDVYECKFTNKEFNYEQLETLKRNASFLNPSKYGVFSKSGASNNVINELDYIYTLNDLYQIELIVL